MSKLYIPSISIVMLILFGCLFDSGSDTQADSGGGTEVVGKLILEDGTTPAVGARVELHITSSGPLVDESLAKTVASPPLRDTITDNLGTFVFANVEPNHYLVRATYSKSGKILVLLVQDVEKDISKVRCS